MQMADRQSGKQFSGKRAERGSAKKVSSRVWMTQSPPGRPDSKKYECSTHILLVPAMRPVNYSERKRPDGKFWLLGRRLAQSTFDNPVEQPFLAEPRFPGTKLGRHQFYAGNSKILPCCIKFPKTDPTIEAALQQCFERGCRQRSRFA